MLDADTGELTPEPDANCVTLRRVMRSSSAFAPTAATACSIPAVGSRYLRGPGRPSRCNAHAGPLARDRSYARFSCRAQRGGRRPLRDAVSRGTCRSQRRLGPEGQGPMCLASQIGRGWHRRWEPTRRPVERHRRWPSARPQEDDGVEAPRGNLSIIRRRSIDAGHATARPSRYRRRAARAR